MSDLNFVSIVMTYYERLELLRNTLRSFQIQEYTNFEVVIVDDGSLKEPISNNTFIGYDFPIHVINMPHIKKYTNTCVPYNVGFAKAKGEIVIIQNAECLHLGNILEHARCNITDNNYFSYSCYSLGKEATRELNNYSNWNCDYIQKFIIANPIVTHGGGNAWKNHSIYRPLGLHFTSAITKNNLNKLGGFDNRYSNGTAFEDNEILTRIKNMGLTVTIIDNIITVHQWHVDMQKKSKFETHTLYTRNRLLYHLVTKRENQYYPNQKSPQYIFYKIFRPFLVIAYMFAAGSFMCARKIFNLLLGVNVEHGKFKK